MLLETILFLTLKIKQNKFTKSVVRCEFDDLKIKKNIYIFGGAKETFGGAPAPALSRDRYATGYAPCHS